MESKYPAGGEGLGWQKRLKNNVKTSHDHENIAGSTKKGLPFLHSFQGSFFPKTVWSSVGENRFAKTTLSQTG